MKSYNVYSTHKGTNITLPTINDLAEAKALADAAASLGHECLYRVFERTTQSPTGEQFVVAWSVLGGEVRRHNDPTIPGPHW